VFELFRDYSSGNDQHDLTASADCCWYEAAVVGMNYVVSMKLHCSRIG
jgi:hypothetical protein